MSDYKKVLIKLINSEITGYQIYKKTGVSQSVISGLRNGKKAVSYTHLTLPTILLV